MQDKVIKNLDEEKKLMKMLITYLPQTQICYIPSVITCFLGEPANVWQVKATKVRCELI